MLSICTTLPPRLDTRRYEHACDLAAERYHRYGARPRAVVSNARCEAPVLNELRKRRSFAIDSFNEVAARCGLDQRRQQQDLFDHLQARGLVETLPRGVTRHVSYQVTRRKGHPG